MFQDLKNIFMKEFGSYFKSGLAYFVLAIYLLTSMASTFYLGNFFNIVNQSLYSYFYYQPGILISLIPALTMKLWADEKRYGTIELLLTQPLTYQAMVWGKFMAAWAFSALMVACSLPFCLSAAWFVQIDIYNIISSYIAVLVVSGMVCALGCAVSSLNRNPVSAYILTVFIGTILKITDFDFLIRKFKIANEILLRISKSLNFNEQYETIIFGQLTWSSVVYFLSLILFGLWINLAAVKYRRD